MDPPQSNPLLLRIPRSLTAPDAWLAILLASFFQYKQYTWRREHKGKGNVVHVGAKSKPKGHATWSLLHEWLFTNLRMMVSPISNEASQLNADMVVDLKSDRDLDHFARKAAAGKMPTRKTSKNNAGGGGDGDEKKRNKMEVRTRRIVRGEMVYMTEYPLLETTINLSLAVTAGVASRWMLGLFRSLTLSSVSSSLNSPSGLGGLCCSPYRGSEDEGSRLPGSFERLLACVLIKKEGDDAGIFLLTLLLTAFTTMVVKLAWSVSDPFNPKTGDLDDESDANAGKGIGPVTQSRVDPQRAKRFFVGLGVALFSYWFFLTPALLRAFGLDSLPEAAEEMSGRILLFGNLLGIVSTPSTDARGDRSDVSTVMHLILALIALAWGFIASSMMTPIEETARNAAHILSPTPSNKRMNPMESMDLINVRTMLLIQALSPLMIMCTYLFHARFSETAKSSVRNGQIKMSFSKLHLQQSGLFVRGALSWCFLAASSYCLRSLLQSYMDQAASVASVVGIVNNDAVREGTPDKRNSPSNLHTSPPNIDPFHYRYKNLVPTAGRIAAFPAFVLAMLIMAHLRGGDGSTHPGVGYESQSRHAPRSIFHDKKLLPPYGDQLMVWISKHVAPHHNVENGTGEELLHVAALSQASWHHNPLRDSTQKAIINWLGKRNFCYPPEFRSIKAMGRHVNFLLSDESDGAIDKVSILTMHALTGRELLELAPQVPTTLFEVLFGRKPTTPSITSCIDTNNIQRTEECNVSEDFALESQLPSLYEMFSFLMSHHLFTPTIVFPLVDAVGFLGCVWWNYWYTIKVLYHWIEIRRISSKVSDKSS
jgi:hypothetical protein